MRIYLRVVREILWARKLSVVVGIIWMSLMIWGLKGYLSWPLFVGVIVLCLVTASGGVLMGCLHVGRLAKQMGFSSPIRDEILLAAAKQVKRGRFPDRSNE